MVRNVIAMLVVALTLGASGTLGAPGTVAAIAVDWLDEGQLVYRSSASLGDEVGYVNGQYLQATAKPETLRAEPPYGSQEPQYFVWSVNGGQRVLVLDESKGSGRGYDRLFVDQNGDGVLAEGEQVRGWRRQGNLVFGPVRVSLKTDHGPRLYHFLVRGYAYDRQVRYLNLESACYYLGRIRLGEQSHKLALVDNNGNGVFNDFSTSPGDGDRLLIDLDGDGQFAVNTGDDPETFPLGKLLQVGDDYVAVEVAPDGSQMATSVPDLKFGQVRSAAEDYQILLSSAEGMLRVRAAASPVQVPVGEYRLCQVSITQEDDQGRRWELTSSGWGEEGSAVQVAEGETTELPLGSPLQARVTPRVDGRNVSFSLQLTDAAGLDISNVAVNGQRPAAPKLRIKRTDGQEIGCYDFQYG